MNDIDALRDCADPAGTEQKFRAMLPETGPDIGRRAELLTRIARAQRARRACSACLPRHRPRWMTSRLSSPTPPDRAPAASSNGGGCSTPPARRPAENEWGAGKLIAHFILCERDDQGWAADMLNDVVEDRLQMRPNANARIGALVRRPDTAPNLLAELTRAEAETAALLEALPAAFVRDRKHPYRRLALWAPAVTSGHWDSEHAGQMKRAVEAARG